MQGKNKTCTKHNHTDIQPNHPYHTVDHYHTARRPLQVRYCLRCLYDINIKAALANEPQRCPLRSLRVGPSNGVAKAISHHPIGQAAPSCAAARSTASTVRAHSPRSAPSPSLTPGTRYLSSPTWRRLPHREIGRRGRGGEGGQAAPSRPTEGGGPARGLGYCHDTDEELTEDHQSGHGVRVVHAHRDLNVNNGILFCRGEGKGRRARGGRENGGGRLIPQQNKVEPPRVAPNSIAATKTNVRVSGRLWLP